MNKNVKRLLAMTLAFVMVFALAVPVLAAPDTGIVQEIDAGDVDAKYIKVSGLKDRNGNSLQQDYLEDDSKLVMARYREVSTGKLNRLELKQVGPIVDGVAYFVNPDARVAHSSDYGSLEAALEAAKYLETGTYRLEYYHWNGNSLEGYPGSGAKDGITGFPVDAMVIDEFNLTADLNDQSEAIRELDVVVPTVFWKYTIRVKDGYNTGVEGAKVNLFNLKKTDDGDRYVLDDNKNYVKDGSGFDKTVKFTDGSGYVKAFKIVESCTSSTGYRLWINGEDIYYDIEPGEYIGAQTGDGGVYALNPWKDYLDGNGPVPVTEEDARTFVVYQDAAKGLTMRVKVQHGTKYPNIYPVAGATVKLYEYAGGIYETPQKGDFIAEGVTKENGEVLFVGLPLKGSTISFLTPGGEVGFAELPYVIEITDVPEGYSIENSLFFAKPTNAVMENKKWCFDVETPTNIIGAEFDNYGRIWGADRYETAIAIAEELKWVKYHGAHYTTAILADGSNFADALVGGVLAYADKSPMLLTNKDKLTPVTKAYIESEGINDIIILGGPYSVSEAVRNELAEMGVAITRVYGQNRAETAVGVAKEAIRAFDGVEKGEETAELVFLADQGNFADALTASVPAAKLEAPILLTDSNTLTAETAQAIKDLNVETVYIVGGPNSVSDAVQTAVEKLGVRVERYYGENRATTAMELAKVFYNQASHAYVASGTIFADALAGAPLAVANDSPILLINKDSVPEAVAQYIQDNNVSTFTILGGPNTISAAARADLLKVAVPAASKIQVQ